MINFFFIFSAAVPQEYGEVGAQDVGRRNVGC